MNKRELTEEDIKIIKSHQECSPVVKFLKNKSKFNFTVGDYLIKLNKSHDDKWEIEKISGISSQSKRFICIHEDEYGIKYIKPLTSLGTELPYINQLTDVSDWTRYEVDPEYAEHIILDGESDFDFSSQRKAELSRRNAITRKNKKISEKINSAEQAEAFIRSRKPGDKVWLGWNIPEAASSEPMTFHALAEIKNWNTKEQGAQFLYKNGNTYSMSFNSMVGSIVFVVEPYSYETI